MTIWQLTDMHARHARIQEFSSRGGGGGFQVSLKRGGGFQVSLTKKALTSFFFFSPQLILQKSNGQFERNLSFFKVPEGVQHFPGGIQLFPGGSNCLFPIETHITCEFPGRSGPPVPPPSGSALAWYKVICPFYTLTLHFFEVSTGGY